MSAIIGIYHFNHDPIDMDQGRKLMGALQKYPADAVQTWHSKNVFLGCHAQWITPESVGEQLPYYDHQRQLAITADAIIDNRDELFERLQVEQEHRKRMPDSELILLAYLKWGEEAPKYLIGDFAFMIWDERRHLLFGARDFSGSRTLYYYHAQHRFAFCTIIEPLLSLPYVERKLNEDWLAEFLAIPGMFEAVSTSSSVYQAIKQIPPSHTISICEGKVKLRRYYTLSAGESLKLKSNQEYEEAFREVFQSAVTARLRTHRQVGAHLSGGLDSGSVVSFAAHTLRKENKRLHTFSYIPVGDFKDWTPKHRMADERPYIQSIVQHVGNITDHYFDFEGKSPFTEVDDWLDAMEAPYKFFENSFWLKGIYERAHQQQIGVLLNGARGNFSISWGPALDFQANLLKKWNWIRFFREVQLYSKNTGISRSRIWPVVRRKAFPFINGIFSSNDSFESPALIHPEFAKRTNIYHKLQEHGIDHTGTPVQNVYEARKKHFEQLYYWTTNGTVGTKLSLRYSLWDRDPTNDLRVIRFCLSVPEEQYVQNGVDRALIRRSTKSYLPDKVRLNQRVRGIQGADGIHRMAPSWNTFIEELQQLSRDPEVSEYLNIGAVKQAISKVREQPHPKYIYDAEFKILMRSLIVYRFIKKIA